MKSGTFNSLDENHIIYSILEKKLLWWRKIKKDSELYTAIRKDNYLNVYYQDGCLVKLFIDKDQSLKAISHIAYLDGVPCKEYTGEYYDISDALFTTGTTVKTIDRIKCNIQTFYNNSTIDRKGISEKFIQWEWAKTHQKEILDLELAFYKGRKKVRLDIVQLVYGDIIFTELKRVNDSRLLRKDPEQEPGIISQMKGYYSFIQENECELLSYYQKIYRIKKRIGLPAGYKAPQKIIIKPLLSIANTYSSMSIKRDERIGVYDPSTHKFITGMLKHITKYSKTFDYEIFSRLHRSEHVLSPSFKSQERNKSTNKSIHGTINNLHSSIKESAEIYFLQNNISWWKVNEDDGNGPSSHCLSSQIHCLNHLFAIRNNQTAVLKMIQRAIPNIDFEGVLKVPIDSPDTQGYIAFEFTYHNTALLSETHDSRGENCTSIDAVIYALDTSGKKWIIPIEWKYTELYNGKEAFAGSIHRYPKYVAKTSNLKSWSILYRCDPYYELARQSLFVEQIIASRDPDFLADDYYHLIICPNQNPLKTAIKLNYLPTLKDSSKTIILSPQDFTESFLPRELEEYLENRYWK